MIKASKLVNMFSAKVLMKGIFRILTSVSGKAQDSDLRKQVQDVKTKMMNKKVLDTVNRQDLLKYKKIIDEISNTDLDINDADLRGFKR
ncbi:MAG: hypothetical protein AAF821_20620 [Cyanobacteria bacterium P01_D01_bin.156]